VPQPSSGDSRYRRISSFMNDSRESGSLRWAATLTNSGENPPLTTGPGRRRGSAGEKPPLRPDVHCIGVRTASRPSASRSSPMPISSP
jgi:hypothetical protein